MSEIRSRPATDQYREGWDRIFGGVRPKHKPWKDCYQQGCVLQYDHDGGHVIPDYVQLLYRYS